MSQKFIRVYNHLSTIVPSLSFRAPMLPQLSDDQLFQVFQNGSNPSVFIELPHGATKTEHYHTFAQRMPEIDTSMIQFFYTNTDIGTPELAKEVMSLLEETDVCILQSYIPRTFVDCNRNLERNLSDYKAAKVTPGLPSYVPEHHHQWLKDIHKRYTRKAEELYKKVCGNNGVAIMLHSYAPKSVGIHTVDKDIVEKLRWAYEPEQYTQWPERPEIDIICTTLEGVNIAHPILYKELRALLGTQYTIGSSQTYPMHHATMAYAHAQKYFEQTLCLEIRRDLLVEKFRPCVELPIQPQRIHHFAQKIAKAIQQTLNRI